MTDIGSHRNDELVEGDTSSYEVIIRGWIIRGIVKNADLLDCDHDWLIKAGQSLFKKSITLTEKYKSGNQGDHAYHKRISY